MRLYKHRRSGFAWLELLLGLAVVSRVLQLFPGLARAVDFRTWTRPTWFVVNGIVVLALVVIRFAPDSFFAWQQSREQKHANQEKGERQQAVKERRESLRRIRESRRRRMY